MAKRPHMDCYAIGDTADFAKTVSEYDIYGFAGIVGDFYAVHLNEEYAKGTRFEKAHRAGLPVGRLPFHGDGIHGGESAEPRRRIVSLRHHL